MYWYSENLVLLGYRWEAGNAESENTASATVQRNVYNIRVWMRHSRSQACYLSLTGLAVSFFPLSILKILIGIKNGIIMAIAICLETSLDGARQEIYTSNGDWLWDIGLAVFPEKWLNAIRTNQLSNCRRVHLSMALDQYQASEFYGMGSSFL
jgi:hypothetical protein